MNPRFVRLDGTVLRALFATTGACFALAGSAAPAWSQCTWEEIARVGASDAAELDKFGSAVAMSGDTALAGAPGNDDVLAASGAAYVFVRTAGVWTEQAKLVASDAAALDEFGTSVALDGDTAVVGAIADDDGGSASGSAYVFVRVAGVWTEQAKLTASDAAADDAFGAAVAVSGDTIVIGAWGDDTGTAFQAGSAYVFIRTAGVWTQQAKLIASDAIGQEYFGYSVAMSGEAALIGAFADSHAGGASAGSAYVFVRTGVTWTEQAKLTASDAAPSDWFGKSVSLSSDTAVVGAMHDDHAGGIDAGSAYVFTRSGSVWTQQAKLTASDAAASDEFGVSVALTDGKALVGANLDDHAGGADAGAAYVFVKPGTGWTTMTETARLIASDAAATDDFGISVAVSGNTAIIGAELDDHLSGMDAGSAYFFECTVPGCPITITASDAAVNDEFGVSVGVSGDTAIVGARFDDNATGNDAGAAYVYIKSGPPGNEVWTEQAKLIGNEPIFGLETGNQSGISVDVSGDTAFVGSWLWPQGNATGLIYIFGRSGPPGSEVWTQQFALACPQFGSFQYFGYSLSLEGDTAVVGSLAAPGLNVGGQVFFYARSGPPGNQSWTAGQKFPSDGVPGDQFGNSVAMSPSQDTAIVGAWLEDNAGGADAGSAYIFTRTTSPPDGWVEQVKLTASDGAAGDRFGVKVAISGDTAVVGAHLDDHAGGVDAGSAYVFTRSGTVWTEQAKLTASNAAAGNFFGVSLALSGDTVVIGAHGADHSGGNDVGSAYVFKRSGGVWTEQIRLSSPDPATDDWFGVAVALEGETPMIGARQDDHAGGINAGSVYIFDLGCEAVCCPGDFDANSAVTPDDISGFVIALLAGGACPAAPACCSGDLNADAIVDGHDVSGFVAKLLSGGSCQ